jgi:hypothetical protein
MSTISLPGLTAEASLYKKASRFRIAGAFGRADDVLLQQLPLPVSGFRHCGPCYRDDTGACVKDCVICPGPVPDGCDDFTLPCKASQCPPCGPCTCTKNCGGTIVPC